jgi:hypothetical protein
MFKVTNGKVEKISPIFGQKVTNRDGSVGTYLDGEIHLPQTEDQVAVPSAPAIISTKGYT